MMIKAFRFAGIVLVIGLISGILHSIVLPSFLDKASLSRFTYSVSELYLFFGLGSIFIVTILIYLSRKNKEQVGYAFLFLTVLKLGGSYALMLPVLKQESAETANERISFFFVFIVFLVVEVFYTMSLLKDSEKQEG